MENIKKLILGKASNSSAQEVFEAICKDILGDLKVDQVSIWHFNEELSSISCKHCLEVKEEHNMIGKVLSKTNNPKFFSALIESVSIKADDVLNAPELHELVESYYKEYGIISALAYVIYAGEKPVGVLFCETKSAQRIWTDHDVDYVRVITVMAGAELKTN